MIFSFFQMQTVLFDSRNGPQNTENEIRFNLSFPVMNVQNVRMDMLTLPNKIYNVKGASEQLYAQFPLSTHPTTWFPIHPADAFHQDTDSLKSYLETLIHGIEQEAGLTHNSFQANYDQATMKWTFTTTHDAMYISSDGHSQLLALFGMKYEHPIELAVGDPYEAEYVFDPYRNLRQLFIYADFCNRNNIETEQTIDTPWAIIPMKFSDPVDQSTTYLFSELVDLHVQKLLQRRMISRFVLSFYFRVDATTLIPYPFAVNEICGLMTFIQ